MPRIEREGEAVPSVNRRRLLLGLAAASTSAVAGTAAIAAASAENPKRVHRLADELSLALDHYDKGRWMAEIRPASSASYPVMFGNIESMEWSRKNVSPWMRKVIEGHRAARAAFEIECGNIDPVAIGREPTKAERRRWEKAHLAEERALKAVCALNPVGPADARAKARYLLPYVRWGELTEDQIVALVFSAVQP